MDTILNLEQSTAIYYVSHILLISSVYAFYQKHYHLFIAPAAIFVTSIHYWKKPDYSYRRYLDIFTVVSLKLNDAIIKYAIKKK